MVRLLTEVLCWLALCCMAINVSSASVHGSDVVMAASYARSAPRIDGKLDDPAWESASRTDLPWTETGARVPGRFLTQVSVVYDDKALYVAFRNHAPSVTDLRAAIYEHDRCLTSDDSVGIFLEPDGTGEGHSFRVTVNAGNTVRDVWRPSEANREMHRQGEIPQELTPIAMAYVDARDWQPKDVDTAVRIEDGLWTVEISIPFEDLLESLPVKRNWGVNFMRRIVGQDNFYATWTNAGLRFIIPNEFGRLEFNK